MNRKIVFYTLGKILNVEAVFLLLPSICALVYKENCFTSLILTSCNTYFEHVSIFLYLLIYSWWHQVLPAARGIFHSDGQASL